VNETGIHEKQRDGQSQFMLTVA